MQYYDALKTSILSYTKVDAWMENMNYVPLKRIFDIGVAVFGIIICLPIFILTSLFIKLDSRGPIFFKQIRCGRGGRGFKMYKFRSMVENAEVLKFQLQNEVDGSVFKIKEDPRVTRIGSFLRTASIDELPQLFNVLTGEMSLVGPRPLAAEEMTADEKWREIRLRVKPGITGLWQVKGRGNKDFSEWIRYDTEYVMNQSLLLDIKILLKTFGAVLKGRGAY